MAYDKCEEVEGSLAIHYYKDNGDKERTTILSPHQIGEISVESKSNLWWGIWFPSLAGLGVGVWILLGALVKDWFYQEYGNGFWWIWVITVWIICIVYILMGIVFPFVERREHYSRITIKHQNKDKWWRRINSTEFNAFPGNEDDCIATILKIKKNSIVK